MPTNDTSLDEVRKLILACLLARPGPTPTTLLDRDYYEMEKERIPWRKFGYANLVEFLKSMPEHFVVEWANGGYQVRGIASEKTKHVSSLVSRQKASISKKYVPPCRRPFINRHMPQMQRPRIRIPADLLSSIVTYVKNNPRGVNVQSVMMMVQQQLPHTTLTIYDIRDQMRELSHFLYLDGDWIFPTNAANDSLREIKNYPQSLTSQPQNMPRPSEVYAGGDEGSDFIEDSSDEDFNHPADHANSNYPRQLKSTEQIAANFANNEQDATIYNCKNDECFAATNGDDNTNATKTDYIDVSSLISDRTKSRLDQLVRQHPEGIWCAELPEKYLKAYNVHLNYIELGFTSVREYVSHLPNIFYMTRLNSTDDFMLYSADKKPTVPDQDSAKPSEIRLNPCEQHDEHNAKRTQFDDNAPIPADVSSSITKIFAPDDVMNYNDSVEHILVTDLQRDRKYLEVYIVEMFHPNFFWVHLRENKKRFEGFMDELDKFYHYNKDKYTIPKIALKKGLHCACIYSGRWHRAIIKSVKPDFRVTVMFYDYGTLKTYPAEDIYYLHKQFSFLRVQAIPCGLYNVKPCVGDSWKKSVIDKLLDRIDETLLALTIMSVDAANNSMIVILSDTSEEEDVHINDWLIKEKLAQCGKMGDAVDMASIMRYVVVNSSNSLPTYCFAEENLISDSHSKATSTEDLNEMAPTVSEQTPLQSRENLEQYWMRPPPGFAPLGEKTGLPNISARNFHDVYTFGSTSKTSSSDNKDMTTNPFLTDQQFINDNVIPNDVGKQIFTTIWNKNLQLITMLAEFLYDLLERSPLNKKIFENHMIIQHHLNRFLEKFVKTLKPLDNDTSSSASLNLVRETTDKFGSTQNINSPMPNLNAEGFVNQKLAANLSNLLLSNSFGDDRPMQTHPVFPTYGSNNYTFSSSWHQSDKISPRVQVPSSPVPRTPSSVSSTFGSSSAPTPNVFFPNTDQGNAQNFPAMKQAYSMISMNTDVSNNNRNSSSFFSTANSEFANMFKETNPFRCSMTDNMQIPQRPETQSEPMANNYDTNATSYLPMKNLQEHAAKMETVNIHAENSGFTIPKYVNNISSAEGYTPRVIYEAGPVMYNMQKKQMDADVIQNACNNDFKNDRNVSINGQCDKKDLFSPSANDIASSYLKNSSHIDESYITQPPTDCTLQNSPQIRNNESIYHQQNVKTNERIIFSQAWKHVEIPECLIKSQIGSVPSQNHNEKPIINTSINFSSSKDWNCEKNRGESVTQGGMVDLSYVFQRNDTEQHMYNNFLNNLCYIKNQKCIEHNNKNNDFFFDVSFVFQKVDLVKNVSCIFHTENEGWMLTYEFIQTFTNFKLCSRLFAVIEAMNVKVTFKEVKRTEYPLQFLQLDNYPLNVPRDAEKRITSIHLISLQSGLSLLRKLKIVTREEIDNAFKKKEFVNGSILLNMWTLICVYRDLRQRIEEYALKNFR